MRVRIERMVILISTIAIGVPFFADASWQSDACGLNNTGCNLASSGFTQPYCVTDSVDYAGTCVWPALTNNLSSIQETRTSLSDFDTKDLILQYCSSLLGDGAHGRIYYSKPSSISDSWDWQQTFDSHQSLFVYALCSSFKDKKGKSPFVPEGGDMLGEAFAGGGMVDTLKLHQRSEGKDLCSLADFETLGDCDMSIYATEIFTALMSDIFKIKNAQVLQVNTVNRFNANTSERVEDFFGGYFGILDKYNVLKSRFPQTVDVLEKNQDYFKRNLLDKLKILDNSKFAELAEDSGCQPTENMVGMDFIACALHGSQGRGPTIEPAFETMFYNELQNYRIFMKYHELWIEDKIKKMSVDKRNEKSIRMFESKASDFQLYGNIQIDAAKFALRRLEDFSMTYPLHIGLLAYQEREKLYRDRYLSPIITIFYSLSEKLQNVQLTN